MNLNRLKKLADSGSVNLEIDPDSGIVKVYFQAGGLSFDAQYDSGNGGIYAFGLANSDDAEKLLSKLMAAEDANAH